MSSIQAIIKPPVINYPDAIVVAGGDACKYLQVMNEHISFLLEMRADPRAPI